MNRKIGVIAASLLSLMVIGTAVAQQEAGRVGTGRPEDVFLEVTVAPNGTLTLSATEIRFALGGYYRFNFVCPAGMQNEVGISLRAESFWQNAHHRLISVADADGNEINFHVQGLNFRLIDCEGLALRARYSFHPMRRGTYEFSVFDTLDPPHTVTGTFIVE